MRARRMHRWLGVVVGCVLIAPSAAGASSARVKSSDVCPAEFECNGFPTSAATVEYEAAAGEPNALELSFADAIATLRDPGVAVSAGNACTSVSVHEAACRPDDEGGPPGVAVRLGDLDDTLTIVGAFPFKTTIDAGPGSDMISDGPEGDYLDGGTGDDRVAGGDGPDQLIGGEGRDSLLGGGGDDTLVAVEQGAAADTYDGGEGRDVVDFASGRRAVTATLRERGAGGVPAEGDVFAGVEDLTGGFGDDRLTGDAGANQLTGNDGSDRLAGGPGPDSLRGGGGRDEIRGDSGDDVISGDGFSSDGDRVFCGPGVDTILDSGGADVLARDCERADLRIGAAGATTMRPHPVAVRSGLARFAIQCRSRRGCRGSVHLRRAAARRGGAQRGFKTRRRGRITVAVPLPRRGALVRVSVSLVRRGDGAQGGTAYTVKLPR
jgi:Ca2+-binding RTX toxin-like protein